MTRMIFAAAAFALTSQAALADAIELTAPMSARSLHDGGVDMVVFYLPRDGHFEVVATYAAQATPDQPARVRMGLVDGDDVRFGLPGQPQVIYAFEREGDAVRVEAKLTGREIAALVE